MDPMQIAQLQVIYELSNPALWEEEEDEDEETTTVAPLATIEVSDKPYKPRLMDVLHYIAKRVICQ